MIDEEISSGPVTENARTPMTNDELFKRLCVRDEEDERARRKRETDRADADRKWKEEHERKAGERYKAFFDTLNMHGKRLDLHDQALKFGAHGPLWAIAFMLGLIMFVQLYLSEQKNSETFLLATPEMLEAIRKATPHP